MKKRHGVKNKKQNRDGYHCQGRVWVEYNGLTYLGFGRIVLLEKIQRYGSIAKAARMMEMSYKHAWDLVNSINNQAPKPLVLTSKGGKGGGGAQLTADGEKAILFFRSLHQKLAKFLKEETEKAGFEAKTG